MRSDSPGARDCAELPSSTEQRGLGEVRRPDVEDGVAHLLERALGDLSELLELVAERRLRGRPAGAAVELVHDPEERLCDAVVHVRGDAHPLLLLGQLLGPLDAEAHVGEGEPRLGGEPVEDRGGLGVEGGAARGRLDQQAADQVAAAAHRHHRDGRRTGPEELQQPAVGIGHRVGAVRHARHPLLEGPGQQPVAGGEVEVEEVPDGGRAVSAGGGEPAGHAQLGGIAEPEHRARIPEQLGHAHHNPLLHLGDVHGGLHRRGDLLECLELAIALQQLEVLALQRRPQTRLAQRVLGGAVGGSHRLGEEHGAGEHRGEGVDEEGVNSAEADEQGGQEQVTAERPGTAAQLRPAATPGRGDRGGDQHRGAREEHAAGAGSAASDAQDHRGHHAPQPAPQHQRQGHVRAGSGDSRARSRSRRGPRSRLEMTWCPHVAGVPQQGGACER